MARKGGVLRGCVALALVLAVSTAPAQAEPVFFGKAAVGGAVGHISFTGSGGLMSFTAHTTRLQVDCSAATVVGEVSGAQTVSHVVIKMTGCETASFATCENTGAKEITTESLTGELGAITSSVPGLRLRPETGPDDIVYECAGGGVRSKVTGSIIAKLSGASGNSVEEGKLATTATLALEATTAGIQKYTHFLAGGSEQWVQHVEEFNTEKGEFVGREEELLGVGAKLSLKSTPAGQFGITK
jgi:hypothetical protein